MSSKKPETIQELIADLENHPNRGKVNGQDVCEVVSEEISINIDEGLYREIFVQSPDLDYVNPDDYLKVPKSRVAYQAFKLAISCLKKILVVQENCDFKLITNDNSTINLRSSVPKQIYASAINLGYNLGLDKHQVAELGFKLYLEDLLEIEKQNSDLKETFELNVLLPGKLYNQIIQISRASSCTKPQAGYEAIRNSYKILNQIKNADANFLRLNLEFSGKSNFRAKVPKYIYDASLAIAEDLGLSVHQMAYLGFTAYVNAPDNVSEYEIYIHQKANELNCSENEIIEAIYGYSKRISREQRLRLKSENDGDSNEPKMDI